MMETLDAVARHLPRTEDSMPAKIVVWEHNSHVGDARVTAAGDRDAPSASSTGRTPSGAAIILMLVCRSSLTACCILTRRGRLNRSNGATSGIWMKLRKLFPAGL